MEALQRYDKARPLDWRKNQDTIYALPHLVIYGCCHRIWMYGVNVLP